MILPGGLEAFVGALAALGARYFVTGSVASSRFGMARSTEDVDVIADLHRGDGLRFSKLLGDEFEVDVEDLERAIEQQHSTNLFFVAEFTRYDVYVPKKSPYDESRFARVVTVELPSGATMKVASAEDVVLKKLEWYRKGGEQSQRQWTDLLGIARVRGDALDAAYLDRWAPELGVTELLARLRAEAGKL